jgi:hypothetical protein
MTRPLTSSRGRRAGCKGSNSPNEPDFVQEFLSLLSHFVTGVTCSLRSDPSPRSLVFDRHDTLSILSFQLKQSEFDHLRSRYYIAHEINKLKYLLNKEGMLQFTYLVKKKRGLPMQRASGIRHTIHTVLSHAHIISI